MRTDDEYNIWYNTYDPNFIDISQKSFVPYKWLRYLPSRPDSILKPVNTYVENLYPAPKLISIKDNNVRLRQYSHADIYLLIEKRGNFYNVDRPWMRQYYQSKDLEVVPENCFEGVYKFYAPWVIDADVKVSFEQPPESGPFHIYSRSGNFYEIQENTEFLEPLFVPFSFKSSGDHMKIDKKFGRAKRRSPMYDIVLETTDIIVEKIRNFYEHS